MKIAKNSAATMMRSKKRRTPDSEKYSEIPEIINRATRRAAASMKRKHKEKN